MPYQSQGELTTDKREVAISETWDSQTDWEAYQSRSGIEITNGIVQLEFTDIPESADLHSHFDAADISSIDPWNNETGESDLSAFGAPTILTGDKNGNNVVSYDGTDDYHATDWNTVISQPLQYFLVFKLDRNDTNDFIIGGQGPNGLGRADFRDDPTGWQIDAGNAVLGGTRDTNWHIANALFDGANSKIRIDGTQIASGDVGPSDMEGLSIAELLRSPGRHHDVRVGEFLLYPMDKTANESEIETYLNDKWAVF